jgi:hypothetical protein
VTEVPTGPEVGEKVAVGAANTGTAIANPRLITSTRVDKILRFFLFKLNALCSFNF